MKEDDDILAAVRDHVRAERTDDAALEAVARGDAAATEELERKAAGGDPSAARLLAAARPLGDAAAARISAAVAAPVTAPVAAPRPQAPARVFSLRRATLLAGPIALAAAMLLYVTTQAPPGGGPQLPEYGVTARGEQSMRGEAPPSQPSPPSAEAPVARIRAGAPDAKFEIVARPAVASPSRIAAWAFAIGDGEPNPLDASVEVAPEGAVRVTGTGKALRGARELRIVIAPAESIAKFDEALARAKHTTSDAHVRVLVVAIDR